MNFEFFRAGNVACSHLDRADYKSQFDMSTIAKRERELLMKNLLSTGIALALIVSAGPLLAQQRSVSGINYGRPTYAGQRANSAYGASQYGTVYRNALPQNRNQFWTPVFPNARVVNRAYYPAPVTNQVYSGPISYAAPVGAVNPANFVPTSSPLPTTNSSFASAPANAHTGCGCGCGTTGSCGCGH